MLAQATEEKVFHKGMATPVAEMAELVVEQPMKIEPLTNFDIPIAVKEKAEAFITRYVNDLMQKTEVYQEKLPAYKKEVEALNGQVGFKYGTPVLPSGYQYWNCLTVGPIQFSGAAPYRPHKIIRAGQLAMMLGIIWVNPMNSDGGGLPGTVVLGDRHYRFAFETMNLSDVTNGPDMIGTLKFGSPAQVVNVVPWFFIPTLKDKRPILYETNFTVDIVEMGQPLAAFSSWHYDIDYEPPFMFLPPMPPHLHHNLPARYMVYPE
jgi:hypothetical protein